MAAWKSVSGESEWKNAQIQDYTLCSFEVNQVNLNQGIQGKITCIVMHNGVKYFCNFNTLAYTTI